MDLDPIPGSLAVSKEYTLDGMPVYHRAPYSLLTYASLWGSWGQSPGSVMKQLPLEQNKVKGLTQWTNCSSMKVLEIELPTFRPVIQCL